MFKSWKSLPFGGALLVATCFVSAAAGQEDFRSAATTETHQTATEADLIARVAALETQLKGGMSANYDAHGGGCGCCGGCESSCGDCCGCCDSCCCSHVYAVYENVFLKPHFSRNAAYYLDDPVAGPPPTFEEVT